MTAPTADGSPLKRTPLHHLHVALDARLVPFAGYEMPVQFPRGIIAEHEHTREKAGLFDVSHMGQLRIDGADRAKALEALLPADVAGIAEGTQRYSFFTNEDGGILDDLMIANAGDHLFLVVNAACKEADFAHLQRNLKAAEARMLEDRALLALQGPEAVAALARLAPSVADLSFMASAEIVVDRIPCRVSRSGYTGEDGFEISLPADAAEDLARRLMGQPEVAPIGLGARDSLRLEAGLC
ncbi:MAG: glycine cleavage system aminomethyltransferase GcvT, partial [Methyloceanibacter sp.]